MAVDRGTPNAEATAAERAGEPLLTVEAVDAFYGDAQALWGVTLKVGPGEVVALIGANGAGKTTTLRVISGLMRPEAGSVTMLGRRLDRLSPHEIVEAGVAQVPEGRRLFPLMTVRENLEMGAYGRQARARRRETMDDVFAMFPVLKERREQLAGTLSGGEQQMVAIGRGLMARPRLLMFDEPSLGLAPKLVRGIFETVTAIRDTGVAVLLVEQNVPQSLAICDRAFVLENGRTTLSGTGRELLANERVKTAYMGL